MPIEVAMPALSPTMEEGTLARWLKKEGDAVSPGDIIAEIETDKATMEVEAADEGTMGKIIVPEGAEGVKVNATIAWLLEDGEDASAIDDDEANGTGAKIEPEKKENKPEPATDNAPAKVEDEKLAKDDAKVAEKQEKQVPPGVDAKNDGDGDRIIASPLARRMAKQVNLDLSSIKGSGPKGRIVKTDIEKALDAGAPKKDDAKTEAVPAVPAAFRPLLEEKEIKHSNVRKVIARRLTEADRDIPQIYLSMDFEIDRLLAARKEINEALDGVAKVSVNDMIVKASALALRRVPEVNAQWSDEAMIMLGSIDVSVAVALESGLITPIIFNADQKGLARISNEVKKLAGRAREGKLKPEEYQGGSFSISNMGMYGIGHFTSIVNPPQAAILAVGAGEQKVVVRDGDMAVATIMTCTLTCDHRVLDGATGAEWLNVLKGYIEKPASMLA